MPVIKLSKTQKELLNLMAQGHRLWSFHSGFELNGRPFWPRQRRTVRKLIEAGYIEFDGQENEVQRRCGIATLGISEEGKSHVSRSQAQKTN